MGLAMNETLGSRRKLESWIMLGHEVSVELYVALGRAPALLYHNTEYISS
jgi:hypothetical protein